MTKLLTAVVLATAALSAQAKPATPPPACTDGITDTNASFVSCIGAFPGNDNPVADVLALIETTWAGAGGPLAGVDVTALWVQKGKSDETGFGPFTSNGTGGTLTFDNPVYGSFVLALKQSTNYSLYLFNGGAGGVTSLHAARVTPPPIPEPETYALMLAGLGVLGFVSRRRKQG
jgi:hypothetical protein